LDPIEGVISAISPTSPTNTPNQIYTGGANQWLNCR
jgi:hypothetical protein